jgi:GGDEF domain-containing protein
VAERLRLIIRQTRFFFNERESRPASLGIATLPTRQYREELIRKADSAPYGSNREVTGRRYGKP